MKETIPIKSTPISLTSAMNVTNSPIQQIMQPSQRSINTSLQQTVLYHWFTRPDTVDLLCVLVYTVAKDMHMIKKHVYVLTVKSQHTNL